VKRSSENAISFFGAGGHKHDGVSSTLISTDKYSLFDFNPGYIGSQSRITIQQANQAALEEWVMNLVNTKVLAPAGLDLAPGLLSGKSIRANTITATELQANTITADEIAANAVTANELAANLVLVNNVIRSNNYDGTIAANGAITANGNAGWAITSFGSAEFANAVIRGNVTANAGSIGGWTISSNTITAGSTTLSSTGAVTFGNTVIASNGQITNGGYTLSAAGALTATGANINGIITSNSGNIGGWAIGATTITAGSTTLSSAGSVTIGATTIAANGQITNGGYTLSNTGFLTATGANITGTVTATDGGQIGDFSITSGALSASSLGDAIAGTSASMSLGVDGLIKTRIDVGSIFGTPYYTETYINRRESAGGIYIIGTASGSTAATEITSSFISTGTVFINGNSVATSLAGKSNTGHTHAYASDPHTHSNYVATAGDTMTGILYGTGIDMSGNLRYGGKVYSDDAGGYAEFGAIGAPTTVGAYVFRINQDESLWDKTFANVSGSRTVYVNSASTLLCGATISSLRFKEDIKEADVDVDAFLDLDVVNFYYIDELCQDPPNKPEEIGVIAEQAEELGLTDLVRYDDEGLPEGLNDHKIPFYLLKTCIKQQEQIDDLKARIQALEGV